MSFAAFLGGGDKESSKGFMGRAVDINDKNKALEQQKKVLDHEYGLKAHLALIENDASSFSVGAPLAVHDLTTGYVDTSKVITLKGDSPFNETNKDLRRTTSETFFNQMAGWTEEEWDKVVQDKEELRKIEGMADMIYNKYTEGLYSEEHYHGMLTLQGQGWMKSELPYMKKLKTRIIAAQNLDGTTTRYGAGAAYDKKKRIADSANRGANTSPVKPVEINNIFADSIDEEFNYYMVNGTFQKDDGTPEGDNSYFDSIGEKIYNEIVTKSDVTGAITDLSLMFPDRKSSVTVGPRGQQGESWAKSLTPEIRNQHNSINYAGKSFAQSANIYFKGALGEISYGEDGMPIYEKGTLLAGSGAVLQTMTENWLDPQYGFIESIARPIKNLISPQNDSNPYGGWTYGTAEDVQSGDVNRKYTLGDVSMTVNQALNQIRNLGNAASTEAILIGMAFQLAIANQDFQGGKAVSDADFQNAFLELTGSKQKAGNFLTNPQNVHVRLKLIKQARDKVLRRTVQSSIISETPDDKGFEVAEIILPSIDHHADRNDLSNADAYYKILLPNEPSAWDDYDAIAELDARARANYDNAKMVWAKGQGPRSDKYSINKGIEAAKQVLRNQYDTGKLTYEEYKLKVEGLGK